MSVNALSQKEYLKKYLSSGPDDKKKKKKKKNSKSSEDRFRIVDDDIDIKNMRPLDDDEIVLYNLAEDAPQIAGIIDERPQEVRRLEEFGTKRWKVVADEDGVDDVKITAIDVKQTTTKKPKYNGSSEEISDRTNSKKKETSESEIKRNYNELDESVVPRKNSKLLRNSDNCSDANISPPHVKWKKTVHRSDNDSDTSPPRKGQKSRELQMPYKDIMKVQEKSHEEYSGRLKKLQSATEKVQHKRKYDSDESPPRKSYKSDSDEYALQRSRNQSDSDVSPPRRSNQQKDSDESPPRKVRKDFTDRSHPQRMGKRGADESPPRRPMKYHRSPPKQREHQHPSDESPPRKVKQPQSSNEVRPRRQYSDEHTAQKSRYQHGSEHSTHKKHKQQLPGVSIEESSKHRESPTRNTRRYSSPSRATKNHADISVPSQRKNLDPYNTEKSHQNSLKKHDYESVRSRKFDQKSPARKFHNRNERSKSPESRSSQRIVGFDSSSKYVKDISDNSHKSHTLEKSHSRHKDSNSMNRQHNRHSVSPARNYGEPSHGKHRQSSPCGRNKSDNDSDVSPTRNCSQVKSSSKKYFETGSHETRTTKTRDMVPERSRNDSRDMPQRKLKQDCSSDIRRENSDNRNSPGRAKKGNAKMLDGMKAGLQSKEELKKELQDFQEREREMFAKLDPSVSGEGVSAILRDRRTGKRRNLEQEARDREEQQIAEAEHKSKYSRWGRGLKQVEDQTEKLKEDLYEMSKPLARYADDTDLERHLRDQEREGDPMLDYIRNKKKEAGIKEKPKYQGSYLPNRFGIPPGHRWDGVDRSSGYEKKWFEELNARRAREEEAYKWSTSDM